MSVPKSKVSYVGSSIVSLLATTAGCWGSQAQAYELYSQGDDTLNAEVTTYLGAFKSQKSYNQMGNREAGSVSWQEAATKYGLKGTYGLGTNGLLYGSLKGITTGTWGDGDPAGWSVGGERRTNFEEAYLGWKSGELIPAFGKNGIDVSVGRQGLVIGDGFIIKNDGFNMGAGGGNSFDRGGAYYLGLRQSYGQTAIMRLGGTEGWRSDLAWLKSANPIQAETSLALFNLEHVSPESTFALLYVHGLDVNDRLASASQLQRKDLDQYSFRVKTNAGNPNVFLSSELTFQDKKQDAQAGYGEAGYTFADLPWSPTISYRYARYSEHYDALFSGFYRGYGTWVQGEVAGNYAGAFNSNAAIQNVGLKLKPAETLKLGAQFFDLKTVNTRNYDFSGRELDLFAEWTPTPTYYISPMLGFYKPDKSVGEGGSQLGGDGLNTYLQLMVGIYF
ncbi:alginate export family protein [Pseudomonas sp. BF-R-01]|uniref:alginate export family protein n=1 Tax=Pseudomonas sp. BF-R-01 TaxID=2832365 RepID=UPI001CBD8290|nr:alginate export family protein [Pseudomonas sp. BF-R-01]